MDIDASPAARKAAAPCVMHDRATTAGNQREEHHAMTDIYHDNGAAFGRRTRFFRDAAAGGVEWMYGVDYANGDTRWYGYLCTGRQESIASLKSGGMFLSRLDNGNFAGVGENGETAALQALARWLDVPRYTIIKAHG